MDVLVYDPNSSNTLVGLLKGQGLSFEIYMQKEAFSKKAMSSRDSALLIFLGEENFDEDLRWLSSLSLGDRRVAVVVPPGRKGMMPQEYTVYERPVSMEVLAQSLGHSSADGGSAVGYEALLSVLFNLEQNMFTGSLALNLFGHDARYVYENGQMVDFLWDGQSRPELALIPMGAQVHGWIEESGAVPQQVAGPERMETLHDRLDSWLELTGQLPRMDAVLDIDERVLVDHLEDIPDMANPVLRLLDGGSTMLDVILSSQYDPLTTARYLAYLYFAGVIYEREESPDTQTGSSEKQFSEWLRDPVGAVQKIRRTSTRKRDTDVGLKLPQPRGEVVDELHMGSPTPGLPPTGPQGTGSVSSQDSPDDSVSQHAASSEPISSDGRDSSTVVGEITVESPNEGINDDLPKTDFNLYDAETIPPKLLSVPGDFSDSEQKETLLGLGKLGLPDLDKADTMILPASDRNQVSEEGPGGGEENADGGSASSDTEAVTDTDTVGSQAVADSGDTTSEVSDTQPLEHQDTLILEHKHEGYGDGAIQEDGNYEPTPIPAPKPFVGSEDNNVQLNIEALQYPRRSYRGLFMAVGLAAAILGAGAYYLFSDDGDDGIVLNETDSSPSAADAKNAATHGTPGMKPPGEHKPGQNQHPMNRQTSGTPEKKSPAPSSGSAVNETASSGKSAKKTADAGQPGSAPTRPLSEADALKREENRALVDQFMRQKSWKFLRMLEKRHAEYPDDLYLKGALAYAYAYKGNSKKAALLATQTLKADSRNYLAWYALASIALERGQNAKMREYFFRFLQYAPQDMVRRKWMDVQTYNYIRMQVRIYKKHHNIK